MTTVDCANFTVYQDHNCGPYCWKTVWLGSSCLTSLVWLSFLRQGALPTLRPSRNRELLKRMVGKPYFWSMSAVLATVVLYDSLIIYQNPSAKPAVEVMVMLSKVLTLALVFQLNFTLSPSTSRQFSRFAVAAYCFTLFLFVLDNLVKFTIITAQVAFKFYTVEVPTPGSSEPLTILDLALMLVNSTFYHSLMQFFWSKLFLRDKDVLLVVRADLEDSLNVGGYRRQDDDSN